MQMSNLRSRFVRPVDWGHERRCRSKMVNKCAGTTACFFCCGSACMPVLCCRRLRSRFVVSVLLSLFPFLPFLLFSPFSLFFSFSPASPKGASDSFPPFTFSLFPFVLSLFFFLFPVPSIPRSRLEKGRSVATATAAAAAMGAPDSNSDLHKPIIPKTPKPSGNWRASQIKELFQ